MTEVEPEVTVNEGVRCSSLERLVMLGTLNLYFVWPRAVVQISHDIHAADWL